MRNKGRQSRKVLTVNGQVKTVRRWWHAPEVGSVAPADAVIDPQMSTVSRGVCEMACRLNNGAVSFETAAANLARTAMVRMCGESLRQLVTAEGQTVMAAQRTDAVPTAFRACECVVDPSVPKDEQTTRIYTGVDGVMVPLVTEAEKIKRRQGVRQKRQQAANKQRPLRPRRQGADLPFKEFKTITFYDEHGRHWHEVLSRKSRTQIGGVVRREADRLGFRFAKEKIANVDGASWIRTQLTERAADLPLDGLGLDFYHLSENVHRCRRVVFADDESAGEKWAGDLLHILKHEGYEPAWDRLTRWRATLRSPKKKPAADRLLNYLSERRQMIDYPHFQRKGWQIGSGPTESRCKTSTSRLKGRGRRWDARNAEAVATLTTLHDSDQWHSYWQTPNLKRT